MRGTDPYLPHRGDPSYAVERYELDLDYRVAPNALTGTATLRVRALVPLDDLELDLVGLTVRSVSADGRAVRHVHRDGRLRVTLAVPAAAGSRLVLVVDYQGRPAPARGPWGEVGWEELEDGALVAGQPDGAPTWFPCNDRPDDKASYRTTVRTGSGYAVVACGRLVDRRASSSRTTWTYEQDRPTATYLATVQVGRYGSRLLAAGPVRQVVHAPRRLGLLVASSFAAQPRMVETFCRLFGEAPFPEHTVVITDDDLEIPVEAQGMAVFGANQLGNADTERLVAHELAHQWFGNSLTVAGWRHVWLNEGFACYAEWLWSEESGGPTAQELARRWWPVLDGRPQDLVLTDPGPARMFDDRVYKRGALALHALRRALGDGDFFALVQDWVLTHRHSTVTTEQFVALACTHGGTAVPRLLSDWLDRPALPPLPPLRGG